VPARHLLEHVPISIDGDASPSLIVISLKPFALVAIFLLEAGIDLRGLPHRPWVTRQFAPDPILSNDGFSKKSGRLNYFSGR
jgi:hypothetical protein